MYIVARNSEPEGFADLRVREETGGGVGRLGAKSNNSQVDQQLYCLVALQKFLDAQFLCERLVLALLKTAIRRSVSR
jgi:hypothetical protein